MTLVGLKNQDFFTLVYLDYVFTPSDLILSVWKIGTLIEINLLSQNPKELFRLGKMKWLKIQAYYVGVHMSL